MVRKSKICIHSKIEFIIENAVLSSLSFICNVNWRFTLSKFLNTNLYIRKQTNIITILLLFFTWSEQVIIYVFLFLVLFGVYYDQWSEISNDKCYQKYRIDCFFPTPCFRSTYLRLKAFSLFLYLLTFFKLCICFVYLFEPFAA